MKLQDGSGWAQDRIASQLRRAVAASGLRSAQVMDALVPWEISSPSNPVGGPWKHWLLGWLEVGNTQLQLEVPKQNELWVGTCLRSQFLSFHRSHLESNSFSGSFSQLVAGFIYSSSKSCYLVAPTHR